MSSETKIPIVPNFLPSLSALLLGAGITLMFFYEAHAMLAAGDPVSSSGIQVVGFVFPLFALGAVIISVISQMSWAGVGLVFINGMLVLFARAYLLAAVTVLPN